MAAAFTGLWFRMLADAKKLSPEEAYRELSRSPESKVVQRTGAGMTDYTIRANSCHQRTVGGLPALSCVADFTAGDLVMAEYLVWISGEKAMALFFGRTAAGEFDAFRERFDRVIETAKIP
jgi:hypothetical protein